MKRGKDEEKTMGPMFPRLHVNDTDKGGPRAPPRNKMALYEQLSMPSQRFSHVVLPSNPSNNPVPLSSQGGGNNRAVFLSHRVPPRHHPIEKQYIQYSNLSTPTPQVEQRQRLDEDDYTVPVFIHSIPTKGFDKNSNPSYFHDSSKFQKVQETGILENQNKKGENPRKLISNWSKSITNSSCVEKTWGDNPVSSTDRLQNDDSLQSEVYADSDRYSTAVLEDDTSANLFNSKKGEDGNIVHDMSNNSGSHEEESCRLPQYGNLERGDSVSETSILDAVSGVDVTPDDVVGVIGQKHFWNARRAIVNQQRVFAVQVFELHRLIKVQKLIAASPHILLEDSSYFTKPATPSPHHTKRLSDYTLKPSPSPSPSPIPIPIPIPIPSKQKVHSENPTHKECSAENTLDKSSLSSPQNKTPPSPPPSIANDHNSNFNQQPPQGHHQWLIPVMSPSEGLIYKPYPGPGSFFGQACPLPGPNPSSAYGFPAPAQHYPFPSFPHFGAHGYFPPYSAPIMTQCDDSAVAQSRASEETESSPGERRVGPTAEGKNDMLLLFPTSRADELGPKRAARVIKVVPRNGVSASESAARIFRSIQEERKQ